MKEITTRSGVAYEGHLIPTPKKVAKRETEETTDKEQTNFQGSTAHIQPPVTLNPKRDVPKTLPKPNIPYPSRLNDQNLGEKATNQMEKFFQIFQDLCFDISFADALILMPKFASTIKSLITNKDMSFELAKIPLNENCSAMLLKNLPEKLGDRGNFLIPFVDFKADPRVPLILGRSFLRIGHALIDFYGEEITLRFNDEAVTFNLNQTIRYSSTYDDLRNPTLTSEPILSDSSRSLTPFEGREVVKAKSSIEEPSDLELKDLPSHLEYAYLEGIDKLPLIIAKDLKADEKEALLKITSRPLILLEKWKIDSWALFLDNGDNEGGEGLVSIGFEGCYWGKGLCDLGGNTVHNTVF
nr:reverse transcriptase domain-containing protein [Tanacetum cinerariifolium]